MWLVDPLDGTKEFIKKNDEFTVNIALIEGNKPVLGVVYAPALDVLYYAKQGMGCFRQILGKSPEKLPLNISKDENTIIIVASRSHLSEEVEKFVSEKKKEYKQVKFISKGSSLKLCLVAEGSADVYPRLGPTMEWDTAAAQVVATEAYKKVIDIKTNKEIVYNKEVLLNNHFIVS